MLTKDSCRKILFQMLRPPAAQSCEVQEKWQKRLEGIAEVIAQVAEEDKADALKVLDKGWAAIKDGLVATIADLRTQVVVMAEALRYYEWVPTPWSGEEAPFRICRLCGGHEQPEGHAPDCRWVKLLSAAPKVLHHEMGKWDTEYLMWPVVRLKRPLMLDARSPDDVMTGVSFCAHGPQRFDEFPGQQAEVIILIP